jgi:hypothetical protein
MKRDLPTSKNGSIPSRLRLDQLYDRLLFWLYERPSIARSRKYAEQMAERLEDDVRQEGTIFLEECRALVCEALGNLRGAIKHRKNEVELIRKLHFMANHKSQKATIHRKYGYSDLRDRLTLLAVLFHDCGKLQEARNTLLEAKQLCRSRKIDFEDEDLLAEYTSEIAHVV